MKIKKLLGTLALGGLCAVALASCGNSKNNKETIDDSKNEEGGSETGSSDNEQDKDQENIDKTPFNIFLAGDSTVKTYNDNQYIAGWGQYLDKFLDDSISVHNAAQGGRSSRSFINEGRLYANPGETYTFSENGGKSIESEIQQGDYLFIQFGHNDDDTKAMNTLADRMVPLGTPDSNGIYPTTPGVKTPIVKEGTTVSQSTISNEVRSAMSSYSSDLNKYITDSVMKYGESYYEYTSGGTYKWFLKQYIDFAREKGATPVLVTPVARASFSNEYTIKSGPGLHGDDFAYVKAVRQLAQEEDCMLVDLFDYSKTMLETLTSTYADMAMAIVSNALTGQWPTNYDLVYKGIEPGKEKMEQTHYNKYGAYLEAAYVAQVIKTSTQSGKNNTESFTFKDRVLTTPEIYIEPSNNLPKAKAAAVESTITAITVTNPNRVYPSVDSAIAKINELPAVESVNADNYVFVTEQVRLAKAAYIGVNIDDRDNVTNYSKITQLEAKIKEVEVLLRPTVVSTKLFKANDAQLQNSNAPFTVDGFSFVCGSDKLIKVVDSSKKFTYNDTEYSFTRYVSFSGSTSKGYVEFTVDKKCQITIFGGSTGADRTFGLYDTSMKSIQTTPAPGSLQDCTFEKIVDSGTYRIASTSGGVYIYGILIEYLE